MCKQCMQYTVCMHCSVYRQCNVRMQYTVYS